MASANLHELFVDEIRDLYHAEAAGVPMAVDALRGDRLRRRGGGTRPPPVLQRRPVPSS